MRLFQFHPAWEFLLASSAAVAIGACRDGGIVSMARRSAAKGTFDGTPNVFIIARYRSMGLSIFL